MSLDISNIVASRICHDIISPIGAIHNGLELISMTASTDIKSPEMALINDSCQDARTRVEFFRIAFGTYQQGQMMEASKIQKLPTPYMQPHVFIGHGKWTLKWIAHGHKSSIWD